MEQDGILEIRWTESDGPVVRPPARQGFGTTLMRTTVEGEVAGSMQTRYEPGGLQSEIRIPLTDNSLR